MAMTTRHSISIFLLMLVSNINHCHSFRRLKRIPAQRISESYLHLFAACQARHRLCHRYPNSANPVFLIRGGNDNHAEYEYDGTMDDFIASFESELADIRREVELEAENEIQKLRKLIERRAGVVAEAENATASDHPESIEEVHEITVSIDGDDNSVTTEHDMLEENINEPLLSGTEEAAINGNDADPGKSDLIQIEMVAEVIDRAGIETDKFLPKYGTMEVIDVSMVESDVGDNDKEGVISGEDEESHYDETEAPIELDDIIDHSAESKSETLGFGVECGLSNLYFNSDISDEVEVDDEDGRKLGCDEIDITVEPSEVSKFLAELSSETENAGADATVGVKVNQDVKPTISKKLGGAIKKQTRKIKARKEKSEECGLSNGDEVDFGESIMLTRTLVGVDVGQPRSGVWFYLRSDLGRALCLLFATVFIAVLTQRLQREMEFEGF